MRILGHVRRPAAQWFEPETTGIHCPGCSVPTFIIHNIFNRRKITCVVEVYKMTNHRLVSTFTNNQNYNTWCSKNHHICFITNMFLLLISHLQIHGLCIYEYIQLLQSPLRTATNFTTPTSSYKFRTFLPARQFSFPSQVSMYIKDTDLSITFPFTNSFNIPTVFGLQGSPQTTGPTNCIITQSWLDISR